MKPQLIDLFSGAGGLSHGFIQAGFDVLAGVDSDKDSLATFGKNHPDSKTLLIDLAKTPPELLAEYLGVVPGSVDCMAGGPPCQGFSRNRAYNHHDGVFVDDQRNYLYWHFFEYVAYFRPKVVLIENVPEILTRANGQFRDAVYERFQSLGYNAEAQVINAAEYGVPQWRRRAIFLAGRDGQRVTFPDPATVTGPRAGSRTPTSAAYAGVVRQRAQTLPLFGQLPTSPTVWEAVEDLQGCYAADLHGLSDYATQPTSDYQRDRRACNTRVANHYPWPLTERQLQRIRLLREGQGLLHLPEELQTKNGYGSAYRRLQSDAQALTLTTWLFHPGSGMFTHPFEDRVVTIREAARLQSFQDDFIFTGSYHSQCRQLGNSVAPLVAKSLAVACQAVL